MIDGGHLVYSRGRSAEMAGQRMPIALAHPRSPNMTTLSLTEPNPWLTRLIFWLHLLWRKTFCPTLYLLFAPRFTEDINLLSSASPPTQMQPCPFNFSIQVLLKIEEKLFLFVYLGR